ncbi:MAG: FecR domain-containing protein [Gallionella sp.]|nr:FecR domain-containing protein [Gallionella sp.]
MSSFLAMLVVWAISIPLQAAEVSGKIGYMSGALMAQRSDGTVKVMVPKSEVLEGDVLVTAKDSYAQVVMNDGTKMTLRPNSNLKIELYQFKKESPQTDNAVFRLMKGGFRTVTGLIGKRGNPDAYKLRAATATIGIRGTDFTSRLCATKDCADDGEAAKPAKSPVEQAKAVGRVMLIQGEMAAKETSGKTRKLMLGSPVFEGDTLMSSAKSHGVVVFRDGGRATLQENSEFQVEAFKYDKAANQENAALRLLKGGVRVVTGLIGRANHDNYKFRMSGATIGIRGTGFDAWVGGACAEKEEGCEGVYVWSGEVVLVSPGGSFTVALNQAASIAKETGKPVQIIKIPASILQNIAPRPDSISIDVEKLFEESSNSGDPGLYVTVHDGQVILSKGDMKVDLGKGESGFTNEQTLTRLAATPSFMGADKKLDNIEKSGGSNSKINQGGCMVGP